MKPLRKDDDSDDDVNNKRAKMSANRETKILNELEMCERTGDVVFRASSDEKRMRFSSEFTFRGRGGREKRKGERETRERKIESTRWQCGRSSTCSMASSIRL